MEKIESSSNPSVINQFAIADGISQKWDAGEEKEWELSPAKPPEGMLREHHNPS